MPVFIKLHFASVTYNRCMFGFAPSDNGGQLGRSASLGLLPTMSMSFQPGGLSNRYAATELSSEDASSCVLKHDSPVTNTSSVHPAYDASDSKSSDDVAVISWYKSGVSGEEKGRREEHTPPGLETDQYLHVPISERLGFTLKCTSHKVHNMSDSSDDEFASKDHLTRASEGCDGAGRHEDRHICPDITTKLSHSKPAESMDYKHVVVQQDTTNKQLGSVHAVTSPPVKKMKLTAKCSDPTQQMIEEKKNKAQEKLRKKLEAEEKRKQKEYEKTKQKALRDVQKAARHTEARKQLTVMLDPGVLKCPGSANLLQQYQQHDVTYEVSPQPLPGLITFWHEVTEVIEIAPLKLETLKKEVVDDEVLLIMPVSEFVQCVSMFKQRQLGTFIPTTSPTLREHIMKYRDTLENRNITVILQGIEKYFRDIRAVGQRQFRQQVAALGDKPQAPGRGRKKAPALDDVSDLITVSRLDIEEALVDIQIHTGSTARFVETEDDVARMIFQYTKSVAEAPSKRDRCHTGFSLYIDVSGSVAISKDGTGVQQVWRKQLQTFKSVTAEVANAIMTVYKVPLDLYEAYQNCLTTTEAELLLQDIVIRRGVGVMATSRRVGKEMSRRLYQLFTSENPEVVLH